MSSNFTRYDENQELPNQVNNIKIKSNNVKLNEMAAKNISTEADEDEAKVNPGEISLIGKMIRKGLVESNNTVEIRRCDPCSPLFSVKTFEDLHLEENLLKGVYKMGFYAPSKIQESALPALLANPPQNLIAQSQSGTGKTAAFVLAMLSRVDTKKQYPQVLCLSPTYELAIQTGDAANRMAMFRPDLIFKYVVRGEELPRGRNLTEHILIGTPGKVLDWAQKYRSFDLSMITVFVLDEADVMISTQGHQDQCIRIHKCLNESCQMMFFSATYDEEVMAFAQIIVRNPMIMQLKREEESLENIDQYYVKCLDKDKKYEAVSNIYGAVGVGQSIIFCRTRRAANWLAGKMSQDGHAVAILTGDLNIQQRISVLDRFRKSDEKVLITTDVLARGIDVEQVTLVVNYDLPLDKNGKANCETYLHKIGRAGRFGKKGLAINLIDSAENMQIYKDIEQHFGREIKYLDIDDSDEVEKIGN